MNIARTWEKLTEHQLATAAADLRNAALVLKHAGHYQGALVSQCTGAVCQIGAIDLATYRKLVGPEIPKGWEAITGKRRFWPDYVVTDQEHNLYRGENAIGCLAATVPTGLCALCEYDGDAVDDEPWKVVSHYNDMHCVSASLAINVMRMAADKADEAARVKREALVPA